MIGLLSGGYFAAESDLVSSLVDALPSRSLGGCFAIEVLCCCGCFEGGGRAVEVPSLTDALLSCLVDALPPRLYLLYRKPLC